MVDHRSIIRRSLLLLFACFVLSSVAIKPKDPQDAEDDCLVLINKKRSKEKLGELISVPYLQELAREHSMKMSKYIRGFGHKGWDDRANRIFEKMEVKFVAENVGFNKGYEDEPAEHVVEGWLKSRQHKENILNEDFDATGIGVAKATDGTYFFTQIFVAYMD